MNISSIKQRFGIIGNSKLLDRAIDIACQVAPTDISVLISGESGSGKEAFPQIIHHLSKRKHNPYIAVNCGAIPEGTIDSELFGHEKGSFTGAHDARKGYFEEVNGGTIFLDEVSELPLLTQVRLLRVLESGEFIKVGSSRVQKTDVRVIAATNVNLQEVVTAGKFREDLYYRLNTVPIWVPPLRERKEDIIMLFKKFSNDFSEKYKMPPLTLTPEAEKILLNYRWSGNVRQLKNLAEQICVIENNREINEQTLKKYLPYQTSSNLPVLLKDITSSSEGLNEREILYKVLFEMKRDITDMKKVIVQILQNSNFKNSLPEDNTKLIQKLYNEYNDSPESDDDQSNDEFEHQQDEGEIIGEYENTDSEYLEENLSLQKKEKDLILKALEKHSGKRKKAAQELGISERTLYRKIKEYGIQ